MTAHDAVVFEAKVYIDGQLDSRRVVKENATWPKVIGKSTDRRVSLSMAKTDPAARECR